jgi:Skp family chaperone for outer membrane proteins
VKRTFILAGGALALVAIAYAGRLSAQQGSSGAAPAGGAAAAAAPRIALVNMQYVLFYYHRAKNFKSEMAEQAKPYQEREKGMRAELEKYSQELAKLAPGSQDAQREEIQKKMKDINRAIEDNGASYKNTLGKKYDQQIDILYREIYNAAYRYALAHDIDLVLEYSDTFKEEDMTNPRRIERVLATPALLPLYAKKGTDISYELVNTLNGVTTGSAPAPAPATGAAPAGGGSTPSGGGATPGGGQ